MQLGLRLELQRFGDPMLDVTLGKTGLVGSAVTNSVDAGVGNFFGDSMVGMLDQELGMRLELRLKTLVGVELNLYLIGLESTLV